MPFYSEVMTANGRFMDVGCSAWSRAYSTVTALARLRGWSTSVPFRTAV